jgi:hypothetical protein
MKKQILLIISLIFSLNLFAKQNDTSNSNFDIKQSCLVDIQKLRDANKKEYYVSLVFEQDINSAKKESKKQILKQISNEIESTATLYYKKFSSKQGTILKEKTQRDFKQDINSVSLNLDISNIESKEYYCQKDDELFLLLALKRKGVYDSAKKELKNISSNNKKIIQDIQKSNNILHKIFLYETLQSNYLPYLMILESYSQDKKLKNKYFKEVVKYQNKHREFLKNIVFLIDIKYPENEYYTIESRVEEVRAQFVKYLAKYKIYATNFDRSIESMKSILKKRKKQVAVLTIDLFNVETSVADKNSGTGSRIVEYYSLKMSLKNRVFPKQKKLKEVSSFEINFEEFTPMPALELREAVIEYNTKGDLLRRLSKKL